MKLFSYEFNDETYYYIQLYNSIKKDILNQTLKPNEKLPSKRNLASHLNISVNTVIGAYDLLVDEGLIVSVEKKGYFVSNYNINIANNRSFKLIDKKGNTIKYDLSTKNIDEANFSYYAFSKISKDIINNNHDFIYKTDRHGDINLRNTIAKYLYETKGLSVNAKNIIIGSGIEYLLTLLIYIIDFKCCAVEDPGYDKIAKILMNNNKEYKPVRLDAEGITVDKSCDLLYVTPANQFPTGIKMSLQRKLDIILNFKNGYIIEDDFDSEFKYLSNNSQTLKSLSNDNVIYLSTFSRTITPALRISYMILPDELLYLYEEKYSFYSPTVSTLDQLILARFISEGYYSRHINKIKALNKQKKSKIIKFFNDENIEVSSTKNYLSIMIKVPSLDKNKFKYYTKAYGIDISMLSDYSYHKLETFEIIVGYSAIDINNIDAALKLLKNVINLSTKNV